MKEIMNPKWEDADDCEDKMPIHKKQKLQIRNEKKKYEKWQTCILLLQT